MLNITFYILEMLYLPLEIQNKILSYLPVLSENQKRVHRIIQNYNNYFLTIMQKKRNYIDIYNYWLRLNPSIKSFLENNNFTMLHIRQFYTFDLNYGVLI